MREAAEAVAARERDARLWAARGPAIGMGVLNTALQGRRVLEEGEGSHASLTPPSVQQAPEVAVIARAQPQGAGGPLDLPIHEFFTNVILDDHSRLPLPALFNLIFNRYVRGTATIREASPRQRPWVMAVERNADGRAVLTGAWQEFALHYELQSPSALLFRHREGTSEFVVKVFVGGCRVIFPPAPAEWGVRCWCSCVCCQLSLSYCEPLREPCLDVER